MNILIKTTRRSSITNKDQRGYSFRTDGNKGKQIRPIMGWFSPSGTVEILNVRWLLITFRYKEGQVDWWIKLQKLHAFKDKDNNQVLCLYCIPKKESLLFIHNILMPTTNFSHPLIQNIKHKPNMVQDISRKMKIALKK